MRSATVHIERSLLMTNKKTITGTPRNTVSSSESKTTDRNTTRKRKSQISNSKSRDSSSKLIFGNAELCSQFLRNYIDIPLLKNVKAEDIEDVSERYVPMFTEERNSDTVKRIKLEENNTLFFVSLIEHKTKVDYNVSMQLLRYMVYIWEDYEREIERQQKGISKTKGFQYPPILPIVYYEGSGKWTAAHNLQERIIFNKAFEPFTPKFFYKLIALNSYSIEELAEKNDELSLVMLINRLQSIEEFQKLNLPDNYFKNLSEHSTDEVLDIVAKVTAAMLRQLNLPETEVEEFTEQVKERKMAVLFEHFKSVDIPAERKRAREEGWAEGHAAGHVAGLAEGRAKGHAEGHAEGHAKGYTEGEARFAKLTQLLLQSSRMDDLTKALTDTAYRETLYRQLNV